MKTPLTIALAASLLMTIAPPSAADPLGDVQKWLGCADWVVEETLQTVELFREVVAPAEKLVKCKLKMRATPIVIDGDDDLYITRAAGIPTPNLANGVVGGSGTNDDPWIIGGFELDGRVVSCPQITIRNVRQGNLRVTGNWVHDSRCGEGAIRIEDSRWVRVDGNVVSASTRGITLRSVWMMGATRNVIESGYGAADPTSGLRLSVGETTPTTGIRLEHSDSVWADENLLYRGTASGSMGPWEAISVFDSGSVGVRSNTIQDAHGIGVFLSEMRNGASVRFNWFYRVGATAIGLVSCQDASTITISHNHVRESDGGGWMGAVNPGCQLVMHSNTWG